MLFESFLEIVSIFSTFLEILSRNIIGTKISGQYGENFVSLNFVNGYYWIKFIKCTRLESMVPKSTVISLSQVNPVIYYWAKRVSPNKLEIAGVGLVSNVMRTCLAKENAHFGKQVLVRCIVVSSINSNRYCACIAPCLIADR